MNQKQSVLIVDSQDDWLQILCDSFPASQFNVQTARTYDAAVQALAQAEFALAVIDPVLAVPGSAEQMAQNDHDGLMLLTKMTLNYPQIRLIVVSGSVGREMLRNSPELPTNLPMLQKQQWDAETFKAMVQRALTSTRWIPQEPQIELPVGLPIQAQMNGLDPNAPINTRYTGLTGPLNATGLTGPLSSGLIPPHIGTRLGRPRVLIVEGNAEWQHRLALMMEKDQYFWRVAANFEQGIERLKMESFHVVVLDLMLDEPGSPMTESKGWPLLEYLMTDAPKTKVIVASGDLSRNDVAHLFMHYPIKGFIDKEVFSEVEFLSTIRAQFDGPTLRIQTLGDFRIWCNEKAVTQFGTDNAERLIKILLARRGENVSVEELIECLWPGTDARAVSAQLGTTISKARSALEPDLPRPNDSHFIVRNGANYAFNIGANVHLDGEKLRHLIADGRQYERDGKLSQALKAYESAREIYQGDYLPAERFERWAIQERAALQGLYTAALNRIADLYAGLNQLDRAIEAASKSLQVDAYNESTYRRLMRYHSCKGNRKASSAVYRSLVKLFSEFFGEEPHDITKQLNEDIEGGARVGCVEISSGEWRVAPE